jgi:hypothetical protein
MVIKDHTLWLGGSKNVHMLVCIYCIERHFACWQSCAETAWFTFLTCLAGQCRTASDVGLYAEPRYVFGVAMPLAVVTIRIV